MAVWRSLSFRAGCRLFYAGLRFRSSTSPPKIFPEVARSSVSSMAMLFP